LNRITSLEKQVSVLQSKYITESACFTGLVDIAMKNPEKYQRIKNSGILEMAINGDVDINILSKLNANSDLTDEIYSDLQAVKENRSIVSEFNEGTPIGYAFSKTKQGDVLEIGDQMYINNGSTLQKWNMTKEKYLELFPPVVRFATKQNGLGNCYFVTSLSSSMNNPAGRADIYSSLSLDGDNIVVTIKGYSGYNGSHVFENGEIEIDKQRLHLTGAKGLQMYEQTYANVALREERYDTTPSLSEHKNPQMTMQRIIGGHAWVAMSEIHDVENFGYVDELPSDFTIGTIAIANINESTLESLLTEYYSKPNTLLNFGTIAKKNSSAESTLSQEYNIVSNHAYTIMGYNPDSKIVTINNPHSSAVNTEIPLSELAKYMQHFDITRLGEK
jgi:hypothetical protein